MKVTYIFTTFPVLSETPYQRELRVLAGLSVTLEIYSLWGGGSEFESLEIKRFEKWRFITLLWLLPLWLVRKPKVFGGLARRLASRRMPSLLNAGETVLGLCFALCYAARFKHPKRRPDLIHAAWATLPATAAELLGDLAEIPFSLGAHAYDVFRHGGDWDLSGKLRNAALVVTSSDATRRALIGRGADPCKTVLVRRGLDELPPRKNPRRDPTPIRILSVGRLVEKKGYRDQLAIYAALKAADLAFEARIVGAGPLRRRLEQGLRDLALTAQVTLLGGLPPSAVFDHYAWADVLLFTGKVAGDGDRDGLPNVVPEAMACGVPVVATAVAGVPEAVEHERSGLLIEAPGTLPWLLALKRLQQDAHLSEQLAAGGRAWVEAHYDARRNMRFLLALFRAAAMPPALPGRSGGSHLALPEIHMAEQPPRTGPLS